MPFQNFLSLAPSAGFHPLRPLNLCLFLPFAILAQGAFLLPASAENRPPEAPTRLLMDLLSEPLALESRNPVMGWIVNDPDRDERQTAYQILVADSRAALESDHGNIWDSGKTLSAESSNVVYAGPPLAPDRVLFWKVRTWDKAGAPGLYSQPQMFATALRDRWLAKAIWGKTRQPGVINDDFVFFRKSFDLPDKEIVLALAHVTALSPEPANQYVYHLRINGGFIGAGPPRGYTADRVIPAQAKPSTRAPGVINRYNTFDVTEALKPGGSNSIGALCHTTDDKRFLFQMKIHFADGTSQTIISDETWKTLPAGNTAITDQGNISITYYHAPREGIDARIFPFGWDHCGYDDASWQAADVEEPIANLTASATLNTRQYSHSPSSVVKKGDGHYYIDFGKSSVAGLQLVIEGSSGQQVEIRLGEELEAPHTVLHKMRTGNTYQESWTLKDGPQTLQHWGYRVFRHVELLNVPEPFDASRIRALELRQPFDDDASSFESSDPMLDAVWGLCKYTIKALSLDMYVDTHTRERLNYEGGIFTEQISDYTVHGEYAFPRFSIEHPYHRPTWPTEGKQNSVMMAKLDYLYTGNLVSLRKHYDILTTKTLEPFINADFLVEKAIDAGGQHGTYGRDMVDWPASELDGFQFTPINTVINAFNYQAIADLADIARILGEKEDADRYADLARKLRHAINTHLFDSAAGKYKDGKDSTNHSIHANAIPMSLGMVDPAHQQAVAGFIASRGMVGSVYLAQFLLDGLYLSHRADAALEIMTSKDLRSWGNMIHKLGATLTGEAWDPSIKRNMSFSHPWATAPANVIPRGLFGIVPLEPGFTRFQVKPQPASLRWAKLTTPSIKGPIHAGFTAGDDHFELSVTVPVNTQATIHLPVTPDARVSMNGLPVDGAVHQGFMIFESVGSGTHSFRVERKR
jgi:alpha-L-rhamnosidase